MQQERFQHEIKINIFYEIVKHEQGLQFEYEPERMRDLLKYEQQDILEYYYEH